MQTARQLRAQIEAALAERIPSALSPLPRVAGSVAPTGIKEIDRFLHGGFPAGALSEIFGPECSGRTSLALTFVANLTQAGRVCAWVDVSDSLHPESAAALGVDLAQLLWIRCGAQRPQAAAGLPSTPVQGEKAARTKPGYSTKPGWMQAGGGGHPRMEAKGLSTAVSGLLAGTAITARCAEPLHKPRPESKKHASAELPHQAMPFPAAVEKKTHRSDSWSRLEQALKVTDLLLQAGGFRCIVLDMGSLKPEYALRVPLATWFRFRAAAERLQAHVLLLTQHACSKSSAGVVLRLEPGRVLERDSTLFNGLAHHAELVRERFSLSENPSENPSENHGFAHRKQPQGVTATVWQNQAVWAGRK